MHAKSLYFVFILWTIHVWWSKKDKWFSHRLTFLHEIYVGKERRAYQNRLEYSCVFECFMHLLELIEKS